MTRETKIGLLVGMGVILFIGILISDYLSSAQRQNPADLTHLDHASGDIRTPAVVERGTLPPPRPMRQDRVDLLGRDDTANARARQHEVVGPLFSTDISDPAFQPDTLVQSTQQSSGTMEIGTERTDRVTVGDQNTASRDRVHHVQEGETLSVIAQRYYGSSDYFMTIYEANRDKMNSPNSVRAGVRLVIPNRAGAVADGTPAPRNTTMIRPAPAAPAPTYGTHTVKRGDSLSVIAQQYYGTVRALPQLIELNRDKIADPNWIPVGTVLKVPLNPDSVAGAN